MKIINRIFRFKNNIAFDHRILFPVLILSIIGLIALKSTSIDALGEHSVFYKQLIWILIGGLIFILIQFMRNQIIYEFSYIFYLILLLLLVLTLFMPKVNGSSRWIFLGVFQLQPSEFGKIILIIALSRFISDYKDSISNHHLIISCGFISLFPLFLICIQPDFGTAIVYAFVAFPMFYWGGIKPFYIFSIIAPLISIVSAFNLTIFSIWMILLILIIYLNQPKLLSGSINFLINISFGIVSPFIWNNLLYEHQRNRISTLINPMGDPQGAGYQVIQSITAIGSGGLWGKGLGEGTQTQLRYLPVRDTDFIISVIGEEMGLFGIFIISEIPTDGINAKIGSSKPKSE